MATNQEIRIREVIETRKRPKRDGYKVCGCCKANVGLRAKQCTSCMTPFPRKEKDWAAIERHASTMKETYIKDKLFDRIDQLATKPGWTGMVFLVHENPESRSGQKRIFQHSYSTKGAGKKMEEAMRVKVFKAMKSFLYGDVTEEETGTENMEAVEQKTESYSALVSQEIATTEAAPSSEQPESSFVIMSSSSASTPPAIPSSSNANLCPSSFSENVLSSSAIPSLPSNATSIASTIASPLPASTTVSESSVNPCPYQSSSALSSSHSSQHAISISKCFSPATGSALRSSPTAISCPSSIGDPSPSVNNMFPLSNPPASTNAPVSSLTSPNSIRALFPSLNASNRQGKIIEVNGKKYFILNASKNK